MCITYFSYQIWTVLIYQSSKQVIENEVNGHQWSPHMSHCYQGLIHDVHPTFLSEDLKHGHEGLQERNMVAISQYLLIILPSVQLWHSHLNYRNMKRKSILEVQKTAPLPHRLEIRSTRSDDATAIKRENTIWRDRWHTLVRLSDRSQSRVSVSSCLWRWADNAFSQRALCGLQMLHEQQWEEACASHCPYWKVAIMWWQRHDFRVKIYHS